MKRLASVLVAALLCGCHAAGLRGMRAASAGAPALAAGEYDNHEQVWAAAQSAGGAFVPHVRLSVRAQRDDWTIWDVRADGAVTLRAQWAMRRVAGEGGSRLVPHRPLVAAPDTDQAFDPAQWAALDACALRQASATAAASYMADAAACAVLAPGVGASAALLPLSLLVDGEFVRTRFYVDQARGDGAREDLRRVRDYAGWVAINGAGPAAAADSTDWHMDRSMRIGNEGGRSPVRFRDGTPSGYSLQLERLTYRDGNVPVLKLSVVDEADGHTVAYAWSDPRAARIGLNLGWIQIGLDAAPDGAPR